MKKIILASLILFLSAYSIEAYAQSRDINDAGYTLICKEGVCLTEQAAIYEESYLTLKNGRFITTSGSRATLVSEAGYADIAPATRVIIDETVYVEEGAAGIRSISEEFILRTLTETAYLSVGGEAVVRVDDYGNAFNYCISGTLRLVCAEDQSEITLNEGEYIAVTVKRGIRVLRGFEASEIDKMNISFTLPGDDILNNKTEAVDMQIIEYDFAENKKIYGVDTNNTYKILSTASNDFSQTLYLDCNLNEASMEIYDSDLKLIGKSSNASGAIKPNVRITGAENSEFYIYISSDNDSSYDLYNERYVSIYEKSFNVIKSFAIPTLVAFLIFIIYGAVKNKRAQKLKF